MLVSQQYSLWNEIGGMLAVTVDKSLDPRGFYLHTLKNVWYKTTSVYYTKQELFHTAMIHSHIKHGFKYSTVRGHLPKLLCVCVCVCEGVCVYTHACVCVCLCSMEALQIIFNNAKKKLLQLPDIRRKNKNSMRLLILDRKWQMITNKRQVNNNKPKQWISIFLLTIPTHAPQNLTKASSITLVSVC